ncbi:MAG TPA: hypothetical protein PLP21_08560 [Pyrinomonadaceae bacterium]|nr:hypothetical protein [Acidobacteriota bacterium]HQZ96357.1 hypothetical protein [Pyrinomonadaceae bacterium]
MKEESEHRSLLLTFSRGLLSISVLSVIAFIGLAAGQDADPYKAAAAQAPTMADAPLEFKAMSQRNMVSGVNQYVGWTPIISGRILGRTNSGDAVTIELAQAGKSVRTFRAPLRGNRGETWFEDWDFRGDDTKDLMTAVGQFTATFKYVNDLAATTTPLAVRKFNVLRLVDYENSKNVWKYGTDYGDLLGFSYLVERQQLSSQSPSVWIYTWMNLPHDSILKDITYRIEVDGKIVPPSDEFDAGQNHESITTFDQEEAFFVKAANDRVINKNNVYLVVFRPRLIWGPKSETAGNANWMWLVDHPGKWSLKIRIAGEVVRDLRFTVLPNGHIQRHPEQDPATTGSLNLGPGRYFVETYFPNPNAFDGRFDADAIREGTLFGRPWTSREVKEGMLMALPPKNAGKIPFPQPALPPVK